MLALRSLTRKIQNNSPLWVLQRLFERIPDSLLKLRLLYFLKYSGEDNSRLRPRFPGTIRWGGYDDLTGMVTCASSDKTEIFHNRLDKGDTCIVAEDRQGIIRGYGWVTLDSRHEEDKTGCVFEFPSNSIYAYDIYIDPEYRLSGAWVGFMQLILRSPHYNSIAGLHCFIAYGNTASLKPHFRYGFNIYERKVILSISGHPFTFTKKLEHSDKMVNKVLHEG